MTIPSLPPHPDTIQRYLDERYLAEIAVTRQEIASMWLKAECSAADARLPGLSLDGQIKMAYDAQMQMAATLLWVRGFRTVQSDKSHHFRLIDSVRVFAQAQGNVELQRAMQKLDELRQDRSQAVYEQDPATPGEAASMMANLEVVSSNARQSLDALLVNLPQQTPPTVRTTPRNNLKRGRSR
jgi:hypothetical protein